MLARAEVIRDVSGRPSACSAVSLISPSETARRKTEARLAAIVQSSDDAIVGKTLDGIVTSWNEGARRLFGYTAEEMVGQPLSRLIPKDRLDEEPTFWHAYAVVNV